MLAASSFPKNTVLSHKNRSPLIAAAALLGALGVAGGAFGAHALSTQLTQTGMTQTWETAVLYHLVHAVAALAAGLAALAKAETLHATWLRRAAWCWLAGVVLFSGSLYALALDGPRLLGPVTPLGGLLLLAGWLMIAATAWRKTD